MSKLKENKKRSHFFSGKLSYLRGIEPDDYNQIAEWVNDPKFNEFLYQGWKPVDAQMVQEQFEEERQKEGAIQFAQCLISTDEMLGWCGLYKWEKIAHSSEIRSFVGPQHWGGGYGTEQHAMLVKIGFDRYNMNRIWLGTHQDNKGILRIYEKLGFTKEGVLRQEQFRRGKYFDAYRYAILKQEYNEKVKKLCESCLI